MNRLKPQPTLVDQVYEAILSDISEGKFDEKNRLKQEEIAESLGVSRQPVQQALLLLRSDGLVRDAPGRGLVVSPLEFEFVRDLYEVRAAIDKLATGKAAERGAKLASEDGEDYLEAGRRALSSGSIAELIAADVNFHFFIYGLAGNPLIAETSRPHWNFLRRVMGQVLLKGEPPVEIWNQHADILGAVIEGNVGEAERLAGDHIVQALIALEQKLKA
jgi:DNA-binding GntR family transcriptional regulator